MIADMLKLKTDLNLFSFCCKSMFALYEWWGSFLWFLAIVAIHDGQQDGSWSKIVSNVHPLSDLKENFSKYSEKRAQVTKNGFSFQKKSVTIKKSIYKCRSEKMAASLLLAQFFWVFLWLITDTGSKWHKDISLLGGADKFLSDMFREYV